MGELIRREGGLVRRAGDGLALAGPVASSTAAVSFGAVVILWRDLARETRDAARRTTRVVAEAVVPDPRHRTDHGRHVEVATGWRMYEDAVVLVDVQRPLKPVRGAPAEPAGPWEHVGAVHLEAAGSLRRRSGLVAVGAEVDRFARRGPAAVQRLTTVSGAPHAWSFLPGSVRTGAEGLIPDPEVWVAQLVQRSDPGGAPIGQTLTCVLVGTSRVLSIEATRDVPVLPGTSVDQARVEMARAPWIVEQAGFDLRRGADTQPSSLPSRAR